MIYIRQTQSNQRGLTLVELMVALTIGLFLLGAVSAIFLNTKRGFDYGAEVARVQETGRFALEAIARDIRMAGFNGCGKSVPTYNVLNNASTNDLLNFSVPIKGYDNGAFSGSSAGTDAIVIMGGSTTGDMVVQSHNPASAQIDTSTHSVQAGEILLITDCSKASIFQVTGPTNSNNNATNVVHNTGTGTPGNCTKFLAASCPNSISYTYKPGSIMMRLSSTAYYIAAASSGTGMKSLYSKELEGTAGTPTVRELLTGVDDMQLAYGLDSNGDGVIDGSTSYVAASSSWTEADWKKVIAVRVSLLVRSTSSNTTTSNQPYVFTDPATSSTGSATTPSDKILRQVFTETVILRNRTY